MVSTSRDRNFPFSYRVFPSSFSYYVDSCPQCQKYDITGEDLEDMISIGRGLRREL